MRWGRALLREAELFVMAEQMLVEVLGRIRPVDCDILLPPMHPGADRPMTMAAAVAQHLRDDSAVPAVLADGRADAAVDVAVVDVAAVDVAPGAVSGAAEAACSAARGVADAATRVHGYGGELTAGEYLLRATLDRSLLAHYVAAYLGSTACPLPEELARPLWELTEPVAARWRELGYFREPMPLPPYVSWRDRFLLCAGHQPHPLGH